MSTATEFHFTTFPGGIDFTNEGSATVERIVTKFRSLSSAYIEDDIEYSEAVEDYIDRIVPDGSDAVLLAIDLGLEDVRPQRGRSCESLTATAETVLVEALRWLADRIYYGE